MRIMRQARKAMTTPHAITAVSRSANADTVSPTAAAERPATRVPSEKRTLGL